MPDSAQNPRDMLKEYADTLIANAQASTQEELDEVADDLIEITGKIGSSRPGDSTGNL